MIQRLLNMIAIGRLKLTDDTKQPFQALQVSEGNTGSDTGESISDKLPMIGRFGFSSSAPIDAEVLLVRLGGNRLQTIAIGSNHRPSRPTNLQLGDSMLYRAKDGALDAFIWLKDGVITIDAANGDVMVQNADTVTIKASTKVRIEADKLEVTGDVVSRADGTPVSLNGLRDAYHAHHHTGVSTGGGTSGPTDHDV